LPPTRPRPPRPTAPALFGPPGVTPPGVTPLRGSHLLVPIMALSGLLWPLGAVYMIPSFPRSAWERDVFDAPRRAPQARRGATGRLAAPGHASPRRPRVSGRGASPPVRSHAERGNEEGERERGDEEGKGSTGTRGRRGLRRVVVHKPSLHRDKLGGGGILRLPIRFSCLLPPSDLRGSQLLLAVTVSGGSTSLPPLPGSSFPRSAWERHVFDAPRRAPQATRCATGRQAALSLSCRPCLT